MRKIFTALVLTVCMCGISLSAEVNPDPEIHRVIGGLYSLVSALALKGEATPNLRSVREYFADAPADWLNTVRLERVNTELWAGVPVGKFSPARKYLRSNAPSLGITDTPSGSSWMGGDFAWLKAGNIRGGKFTPSSLKAAQSEGALFFSTEEQSQWWLSYPSFNKKSSQEVLRRWGVKQDGLHKPAAVSDRVSIYDEVKPSAVGKPDEMHSNRKREFGEDYDIGMGDVIFKPIPSTKYEDNRISY